MKIAEQTSRKLVAQTDLGRSISWEFITIPIVMSTICFCYLFYLIIKRSNARTDIICVLLFGSLCLAIFLIVLNARFVVRNFIFDKDEGHLSVMDKGLLPYSQGGSMLPLNEIVDLRIERSDEIENGVTRQHSSSKIRCAVKLIRFSGSPVLIDSFYIVDASQGRSDSEVVQQLERIVNSINAFLAVVQSDQGDQ